MGVYHFMGVGLAVGAVTCAVDYIEKALDAIRDKKANSETLKLFGGSGGINHEETERGKIEAIVLFSSKEVINGELNARPYTGCASPGSVHDEIVKNLKIVWKRSDADEGRKIFWCEVDIDNFQDCFEKIIKVAYRFSPAGKQGKEIWCNLTGGSNSIGFALLSMARLTGMSTKHYLITQTKQHQKEVQVPAAITIQPNRDEYFNIVPFLKSYVDTFGFYNILLEIESLEIPVTTKELFDRLRGKHQVQNFTFEEFKRQCMLKLYSLGYTQYAPQNDLVSLSEAGKNFINNELEALLPDMELDNKILQQTIDIVAESKKWQWFQEETI